ncbi:ComF family protein [Acinetobacter soli]|uniref:ComF family protein n=1 Tax=Acinetobacter soli TaxID=487316 RepID=UPI000469D4C9|nr:ComF family protein [Acinetobacter soli]
MPMFKAVYHSLHTLWQHTRHCPLCGHSAAHSPYVICTDCWQDLPWLNDSVLRHELNIQAACEYADPINQIVQQFKYHEKLHHQRLLTQLILQLPLPRVQAIVPMPISTARLCERGYNQAMLIAEGVAKQLNLPIWQPVLRRAEHTQKGLSRLERIAGIEQQFVPDLRVRTRFRRVMIIDDVVTTGSSIYALSQALTTLGCQRIYPVCVATASVSREAR